ncbi:MAG: hypothetical protein NC302_13535 [Bacteroidales bacterium]|nr:hypothetical protein [Bacteroidales bacterium]MCM1417112.1 hypothetical protein [bacterium]MCM1424940.1 hypothetical protein [bacterium]
MNHINWVQQREDFDTKYHVIKWKTSHFHEPFSVQMTGSAKLKSGGAPEAARQSGEPEGEGIGFGLADKARGGGIGLGSSLDGYALRAMQEEMTRNVVRDTGSDMRTGNTVGAVAASVQTQAAAQTQAAEHTVTPEQRREPLRDEQAKERDARESTTVLAAGKGNIKNRLRESADKLWKFYQKQRDKMTKVSFLRTRPEPEKKKTVKGTRMADREAVLAMQAENHYLLDSYDQKGNYSTLGK